MNEQEREIVCKMIRIYCKAKHTTNAKLCEDCQQLADYASTRLEKCKFGNEKPTCEKCPIHCFAPKMKDKIQLVMQFAGPRMLLYHPITAIKHLLRNTKRVR